MTPLRFRALAAALLMAGGACAQTPVQQAAAASAPQEAAPAAQLAHLLEASDEAMLERNPMHGLFRGDLRRAGRHGDFLSDAHVEAERRAAANDLAALARIPGNRLSAVDRVAYDTFAWSSADALARNSAPASAISTRLPLDQMGWHLYFPMLSSGESVAPYRTVEDYENGLSRIDGFVAFLDQAVGRMKEGMRMGIVQPRFVVDRLIGQFQEFASQEADKSPYLEPIRKMPTEIAAADRERLGKAYQAALDALDLGQPELVYLS